MNPWIAFFVGYAAGIATVFLWLIVRLIRRMVKLSGQVRQ